MNQEGKPKDLPSRLDICIIEAYFNKHALPDFRLQLLKQEHYGGFNLHQEYRRLKEHVSEIQKLHTQDYTTIRSMLYNK